MWSGGWWHWHNIIQNNDFITANSNILLLKFYQFSRGGVLEDSLSSPWPWPRSFRSLKIALSSARGQHYFFNRWNFVGKHQKPGGKFANTFFVFLNWSISVARGRQGARAPPQSKLRQWQKCDKKVYCFYNFSFFLAFFAYNSN